MFTKPFGLTRRRLNGDYGNHPKEIIDQIKQIKNKFNLRYFHDDDCLSDYIHDVLLYIHYRSINLEDIELKMNILDYIVKNSGSSKYVLIKEYINSIFTEPYTLSIERSYFEIENDYDRLFYCLITTFI